VPDETRNDMPSALECLSTTVLVMGNAIVAAKLRHAAPDLLIRPNVGLFRTLDFYRASAILRASDPVKVEVKEKLGKLLAS
jgi:NTE family protein